MLIISSVEAARGAEFQYGPPDPTALAVTCIAKDGTPIAIEFENRALRQFADLISQIERQFPGALRGH
jgi:hypothetical protein